MTTEAVFVKGGSDPKTVLLVDTEVLSRLAIAQYLRDCEYHVIEASGPEEAMVVLKQPDLKVDILLSDVASQSSIEDFSLAKWTRENRPGVAVLMAGSINRAAEIAGEVCEQGPLLAKPYEPQVVVDRIKRLMATRSGYL